MIYIKTGGKLRTEFQMADPQVNLNWSEDQLCETQSCEFLLFYFILYLKYIVILLCIFVLRAVYFSDLKCFQL